MKLMRIVICLMLIISLTNMANASFNIEKYKSSGFNWMVTLSGNNLQQAKNAGNAWNYAERTGNWIINTYFSSIKDTATAESWAIKCGIPIPPFANGIKAGLKYGFSLKAYSLITKNAPKANKKLYIWTVGPPYPATWKTAIYN